MITSVSLGSGIIAPSASSPWGASESPNSWFQWNRVISRTTTASEALSYRADVAMLVRPWRCETVSRLTPASMSRDPNSCRRS